jgi:glycerol-3-phosphate dehydrogenase
LYELLVIGGGINGLGIAADAAARRLKTLLVEKDDFGGGTTAASSRLIHGGLRYLQYGEFSLVRESLRERRILARQRPHLVRPIRLLIPTYRGGPLPQWKVAAGLALYGLLAGGSPEFGPPAHLSRDRVRGREPGILEEGLAGGFTYPDGQIDFPERLCVELRRETLAAGSEALNHTRVTALRPTGGAWTVSLRDELDGREWGVEARQVVNAAGPWVDTVNTLLPTPQPDLIGGTWGSHLVLPLRPEGPREPLYTPARKDGRPLFMLPWAGRLLLGTTDVPFTGNPDDLHIQEWEIEYLLGEVNQLFPAAAYTPADIEYTTIGVRPLPASTREAAAITRRHFLVDHRAHGLPGLYSVVGGKLTTYRSLAEEAVDQITGTTEHPTRAVDSDHGDAMRHAVSAAADLGLAGEVAARLLSLYGPCVMGLLEQIREHPELGQPLAEGSRALRAEAAHAVRQEGARTVDDIARRRLMLLPPSDAELAAIRELVPAEPR